MSLGVSVVLCCHNSAKRLPETLRHLAAQQVPAEIPWEVVVIDNASSDDTAAVAAANWPTPAPAALRVIAEPRAGLGPARIRGIHEARHEILSFIDDDNWVGVDWVKRIEATFASHPEVGACGGKSEAVTEINAPSWFEPIKGYYAVGSQHARDGDVTNARGTLLWGAGLSLRTSAVQRLLDEGFEFIIQDRKEQQLSTGGDTELCFALRTVGWHLWYDDALSLRHFIPRERLQWDYVRRLMRGMGRASVLFDLYLRVVHRPSFDVYPSWKKTWLFQFLKTVRQWLASTFFHPVDSLLQPEGSLSVLNRERIKGRLAMLWQMRRNYLETRNSIGGLPWTRPGK